MMCNLLVAVAMLMFKLLLVPVATFSDYGFPAFGVGGFDDFYDHGYGHRHNGRGSPLMRDYGYHGLNDWHDDDYGYWRQEPCPHYESLTVSEWQQDPEKQFVLRVALPGVRTEHSNAWLSKDRTAVHVEAMRALPMGRRECLPMGARVSADGHYEILEGVIRVPVAGDAGRASLRHVRGGLQIVMPQRPQPVAANSQHGKTSTSVRSDDHIANGRATASPSYPVTGHNDFVKRHAQLPPRPMEPMRPQLQLPSSAGIVVEEAEYPWPEKHRDASTGWFDNRGDFQTY